MKDLLENRREFVGNLALEFWGQALPDLAWLKGH
jgi:hypothetical protein